MNYLEKLAVDRPGIKLDDYFVTHACPGIFYKGAPTAHDCGDCADCNMCWHGGYNGEEIKSIDFIDFIDSIDSISDEYHK